VETSHLSHVFLPNHYQRICKQAGYCLAGLADRIEKKNILGPRAASGLDCGFVWIMFSPG